MKRSATLRATAPATTKLATYRAMRDPSKTGEPMGSATSTRPSKSTSLSFVIQEHHATSLHWDFRLERDGVLVSWALPKGVPSEPGANHLAIHVEDHPLDYGNFEGQIPKGQYGAGEVTIWDRGTYETSKWRDDEVIVTLHGQRSSGRYAIFCTGGKKWMIHRMDPAPKGYEPMPALVAPMLATPGEIPSVTRGWACEFKWDGVRAVLYVERGRVRALTRNDHNVISNFPELREIGKYLGSRSVILDGEIVVMGTHGRPQFALISPRLHVRSKTAIASLARSSPASFFAFDILYCEGRSLLNVTYDERRELLESLELQSNSFATPPSITDAPLRQVLEISRERGLEGVIVKRRNSLYAPGVRSDNWMKVKNFLDQEVVIGGWTDGKGQRERSVGALLLGIPHGKSLEYVGKVGTGFTLATRDELRRRLKPLARKTSPFSRTLSPAQSALAHFVRPSLVGEVRFVEWTPTGHLRQPSWRGWRDDKIPGEVVRES